MKKILLLTLSALTLCGCSKTIGNNTPSNPVDDEDEKIKLRMVTKEEYENNKNAVLLDGFRCFVVERSSGDGYSLFVDHSRQNFLYSAHGEWNKHKNVAVKDGVQINEETGEIIDVFENIKDAPRFEDFSSLLPAFETLSFDSKGDYNALIDGKTIRYSFYNKVLRQIAVAAEDEIYYQFDSVGTPDDDLIYINYQVNNLDEFKTFYDNSTKYVDKRIFYPGEDFKYLTFKSRQTATLNRDFCYPLMDQITNRTEEYWVEYDHDSGVGKEKYTTGSVVYHVPVADSPTRHEVYDSNHFFLYSLEGTPETYLVNHCPKLYKSGFDSIVPNLNLLEQNNFIKEFVGVANGINFEGHLTVKPEAIPYAHVCEIYFTTKLVENNYILECDQYFENGEKEVWICVSTREANNTIVF